MTDRGPDTAQSAKQHMALDQKYILDLAHDDLIRESRGARDRVVTLVPRRVVAQVVAQESVHELQLVLPKAEMTQDPLPMLPCMVILRVQIKNLGKGNQPTKI